MLEIIGNILCAMLVFAGLGTIVAALASPTAHPDTAADPDIDASPGATGATSARFFLGLAMIGAAAFIASQLHEQANCSREQLDSFQQQTERQRELLRRQFGEYPPRNTASSFVLLSAPKPGALYFNLFIYTC